ncbi:MAG: hypothetical protein QOJ97_2221 [Solirubrobacteraceae bacterium]|jgi:hypothetical protein|nr:hypothetical protein [Solirubrobacteraceae bacterium]
MEGSGPDDGERRRLVLLGFLGALVLGLGAALAIVLASDSSPDKPVVTAPTATTASVPTTATAQTTQTTVTTTEPTTTTVTPTEPMIDQAQAKAAAARGASAEAAKGGIHIPPSGWDTRCTAAGGWPTATRWTCQAAANGGQCAGTIVAYARTPGVGETTDPRIGCRE